MIECVGLKKRFVSYQKDPGVLGSLRSFVKRQALSQWAVQDFSFSAEQGEFIGLLGPNGAGKTTLMKMLTGIIVPSGGHLRVYGSDPKARSKTFRKNIGLVMGQKSQLWWDIPAMDSFLLLQKYYEISAKDFHSRLFELAELLGVESLLKKHVRKLSLGERMKLELIASILHRPPVLFLDEPTIGLDLIAQSNIREFLKDYQKKEQTTIILTSHYMADVEALCQRIVLILEGKKAFDGSKKDFERLNGREKFVRFHFSEPVPQNHPLFQGLDPRFQAENRLVDVRISEAKLRETSIRILETLPVVDFHTEKLPIERVMKNFMEGSHAYGAPSLDHLERDPKMV